MTVLQEVKGLYESKQIKKYDDNWSWPTGKFTIFLNLKVPRRWCTQTGLTWAMRGMKGAWERGLDSRGGSAKGVEERSRHAGIMPALAGSRYRCGWCFRGSQSWGEGVDNSGSQPQNTRTHTHRPSCLENTHSQGWNLRPLLPQAPKESNVNCHLQILQETQKSSFKSLLHFFIGLVLTENLLCAEHN